MALACKGAEPEPISVFPPQLEPAALVPNSDGEKLEATATPWDPSDVLVATVRAHEPVPPRTHPLFGSDGVAVAPSPEQIGYQARIIGPDFLATEEFGHSVAIDGDTAVVGAPGNPSRGHVVPAYVFTQSNGAWNLVAELTVREFGPGSDPWIERFGASVAIDGDTIVVGAPEDYNTVRSAPNSSVLTQALTGSVYVFTKPHGGWVSMQDTAKLVAPAQDPYSGFGHSVAVDGDTVVVGSKEAGSVHVFTKPVGGWTDTYESAELTASAPGKLGSSVDISEDTIAVGRGWSNWDSPSSASLVHIFTRPPSGWMTTSDAIVLSVPGRTEFDARRRMVSLDSDTLIVGGPAYVFIRPDDGWASLPAAVQLTEADENDFDGAVAVQGGIILVVRGNVIHKFVRRSDGVGFDESLVTVPETAGDFNRFGFSIDLDQEMAIIGSPELSTSRFGDLAYVVRLGSAPDLQISIVPEPRLVLPSSDVSYIIAVTNIGEIPATDSEVTFNLHAEQTLAAIDNAEASCAGGTTITCDLGNLAIGAHITILVTVRTSPNISGNLASVAHVRSAEVDLNPANNSATAAITGVDPWITEEFDFSTSGVFDHDDETLAVFIGRTGVVFTSRNNWMSTTESIVLMTERMKFGAASIAIDGTTMVVGTPSGVSNTECAHQGPRCNLGNKGAAHVYRKSGGKWHHAAELTSGDGVLLDRFGASVAISGDTIVVGAPESSEGGTVHVFSKPMWGWRSTSRSFEITQPQAVAAHERRVYGWDGFGREVAIEGDTIVIGKTLDYSTDRCRMGAVYVFSRSVRRWNPSIKLIEPNPRCNTRFGDSVSIDSDTIVVGAPDRSGVFDEESGAAYVFTRDSDNWSSISSVARLVPNDSDVRDSFGLSVSISGEKVAVGSATGSYLFARPVHGWTDTSKSRKFVVSDADAGEMTHRVNLHGHTIAVRSLDKWHKEDKLRMFKLH